MKAILAASVLATLGFALAACGSSSRAGARTFTGPTTTLLSDVTTGETIRCVVNGMHPGAAVPAPGKGVAGIADGTSGSVMIKLTRKADGSLTVVCAR